MRIVIVWLVVLLAACGELASEDERLTPARWSVLVEMCQAHGGLESGRVRGWNYKSKPTVEVGFHARCRDGSYIQQQREETK
jgi:hypothetical protein